MGDLTSKIKNWNWPLLSILLFASILRFWNFFSIPYHHDEISALNRTFFTNFSDLIEYGVKTTDTHPPFVQIWLFYYTKIFGYEEWIVKLPFILVGILSLFTLYKISRKWTNETVALLIVALFSVSQFHIMHSQMIRMYIPGFFFTLQFIWFWSEWVFFKNNSKKNLLFYVLFGLLASLTHHFGLFAVLLTAISGLILIQKKLLFKYIGWNLLIPILYLPNIGVFLFQFGVGGVGGPDGWLGAPQSDFLLRFVDYFFNFSWILIGFVCVFFIYSLFSKKNSFVLNYKRILFSFALFFITFLTAYYYSKYKNPVLQFSTLLFVSPFLFIGLFSLLKQQGKIFQWILIFGIGVIGIFDLFQNRLYYELFYTSGFEESLIVSSKASKQNKNTFCIIALDKGKVNFYEKIGKQKISADYFFIEKGNYITPEAFDKKMSELSKKTERISYFYAEVIPPIYKQIIEEYFPRKSYVKNYYLFQHVIFTKGEDRANIISDIFNSKEWTNCEGINHTKKWLELSDKIEWGPAFTEMISQLDIDKNDDLSITSKIKLTSLNHDLALVATIQYGDSSLYYSSVDMKSGKLNLEDSTISFTTFLSLRDLEKYNQNELKFTTYVWNRSKQKAQIKSFVVKKESRNPYLYGLMEPINN